MKIERLRLDNLREGVFCARGKAHGEEMYQQLEAWLEGDKLKGRIARDDNGDVAGFILYYPIEEAPLDVEGEGLYMVQCLFVKPEFQNRGAGRGLIESALADARESGASGLGVEGFEQQDVEGHQYMPGTFFEDLGMTPGESRGPGTLYYARLGETGKPPRYLQPRLSVPKNQAKVRIDILDCRRCYVGVSNRELVKSVMEQVADQYGEHLELVVHDQNTRHAVVDKGMSSGVFVDGKLTFFRGPVSEEDILNAINVAVSARKRRTDR